MYMALFEYREFCRSGHMLTKTFESDCALSELQRIRKGPSPCIECDRPTRSEVVPVADSLPLESQPVEEELPTEPEKPSKKKGKAKPTIVAPEHVETLEGANDLHELVLAAVDQEPVESEDPTPVAE